VRKGRPVVENYWERRSPATGKEDWRGVEGRDEFSVQGKDSAGGGGSGISSFQSMPEGIEQRDRREKRRKRG